MIVSCFKNIHMYDTYMLYRKIIQLHSIKVVKKLNVLLELKVKASKLK